MLSRKPFWSVTLTLAVVGLAGGALIANGLLHREVASAHSLWKDIYGNPRDLALDVDAIVLATAVDARPGRVAYSDDGIDTVAYSVYEFDVVRGLKGAGAGERLFIERTGSLDGGVFFDHDGGPFEIGHTYMLFLKQQEDGNYFYQVNDQGRYRVAATRLQAVSPDDAVAARFHNRTVAEGIALVREALRGERTPEVK